MISMICGGFYFAKSTGLGGPKPTVSPNIDMTRIIDLFGRPAEAYAPVRNTMLVAGQAYYKADCQSYSLRERRRCMVCRQSIWPPSHPAL